MEPGTERDYLRESSSRRGFKKLWLRISRCKSMEDFLSLLFQLGRLLSSQRYSPCEMHRIIYPHFHPKLHSPSPISQSRCKISSRLMQLYQHLEIAEMISHRQISSCITSSGLKPITSDLNLKTALSRCFTSRRVSKSDKLINLIYCLKYFYNDGKILDTLLQIYYRQRGLKSNSRKLSSLEDSGESLISRISSNLCHEETTTQQLKHILDFADRLSKEILDDLHTPMRTSVKPELNRPCTTPSAYKANRRHYHTTASPVIEKAAERLEQSIMHEALTSLCRLRHFQKRHQDYLNTPFSQHNPSTSKLLTQFADGIASQIMKEASQSAEKRMMGIQRITNSILQSIPKFDSSDLKSALITNNDSRQQILEKEVSVSVEATFLTALGTI